MTSLSAMYIQTARLDGQANPVVSCIITLQKSVEDAGRLNGSSHPVLPFSLLFTLTNAALPAQAGQHQASQTRQQWLVFPSHLLYKQVACCLQRPTIPSAGSNTLSAAL